MGRMFLHAAAFSSDISGWNVASVTSAEEMFCCDAPVFLDHAGAFEAWDPAPTCCCSCFGVPSPTPSDAGTTSTTTVQIDAPDADSFSHCVATAGPASGALATVFLVRIFFSVPMGM